MDVGAKSRRLDEWHVVCPDQWVGGQKQRQHLSLGTHECILSYSSTQREPCWRRGPVWNSQLSDSILTASIVPSRRKSTLDMRHISAPAARKRVVSGCRKRTRSSISEHHTQMANDYFQREVGRDNARKPPRNQQPDHPGTAYHGIVVA